MKKLTSIESNSIKNFYQSNDVNSLGKLPPTIIQNFINWTRETGYIFDATSNIWANQKDSHKTTKDLFTLYAKHLGSSINTNKDQISPLEFLRSFSYDFGEKGLIEKYC